MGDDWGEMCWRDSALSQTSELLPESAETSSNSIKQESESEVQTNEINAQAQSLVGKISNFKYGPSIQEVKTDCNENCRKRTLVNSDYSGSDSKRMRLSDEKTNVITQSLREVRVCSVDSTMDSGEGESVCSETCNLRDWKHPSPSFIKERQISMDSTRDSGIGESSKETEGEKTQGEMDEEDDDDDDDGTSWHPKQKIAVSKRLPGKYKIVPCNIERGKFLNFFYF